jgi:hypothetical protein
VIELGADLVAQGSKVLAEVAQRISLISAGLDSCPDQPRA